jgi:hypothetical protein
MARTLAHQCDQHPSPWDCPDRVIIATASGGFGLPVRDGEDGAASSFISIWHCPWCGAPLPGHQAHRLDSPMPTGKALTVVEVEQRVDAWHRGAGAATALHESLGWSLVEYGRWAGNGVLPTS